jgi:integrase
VPPKPRLHLPYAEWPLPDRLLWARSFGNDDPFGEASHLASTSQARCLWAWRRFFGYLAIYEPTALELASNKRLTVERVRSFVAHLAETNAPRSVAGTIDALYQAARVIMPECDLSWLKTLKTRLHRAAPETAPARPTITSVQLLELGQQLMDQNKPAALASISIPNAIRYRDGLIVALLAFIPLRLKNITTLEIGRHLVREGDQWFITIPGKQTKTGTAIEFVLPELLKPYLLFYLDVVRPRILRHARCDALWVSRKYGALSSIGVCKSFNRLSSRIGFRITSHNARHAAATTWAISVPEQINIARDLLAHSDLRTTIRYYNRARGIEASRAYASLIAAKRFR